MQPARAMGQQKKGIVRAYSNNEESKDKVVKFKEADKVLIEKGGRPSQVLQPKGMAKSTPDAEYESEEEGDIKPVKARPFLFGPVDNM